MVSRDSSSLRGTGANLTISVHKARWILPISQPPIAHGWVAIDERKLVALGSATQSPPSPPIDRGDVAILPGMVNAHTHLEFSHLARPIGNQGLKLHDWIGQVVRHRQQSTINDRAESIASGLSVSHALGTSLIADIATTPLPALADILAAMHHRLNAAPEVIFLAEVLGLVPDRSNEKLRAAAELMEQIDGPSYARVGISPHAPYSTPLAVVSECVELAKRRGCLLAMHVAESEEERELIEQGEGPFAERLKAIQVFDPSLFPWGNDATMRLLEMLALAPRALLIHGNDLRPDEIEFIARHPQMSVVYCPRTHAFFEHSKHPVSELISANVRVALGTDSLASNPDLSIWREVQWLLRHRQDIPWHTVLAMATKHGADAMGRHDLGRIEIGAKAKLLEFSTSADHEDDIPASILNSEPRWIDASFW